MELDIHLEPTPVVYSTYFVFAGRWWFALPEREELLRLLDSKPDTRLEETPEPWRALRSPLCDKCQTVYILCDDADMLCGFAMQVQRYRRQVLILRYRLGMDFMHEMAKLVGNGTECSAETIMYKWRTPTTAYAEPMPGYPAIWYLRSIGMQFSAEEPDSTEWCNMIRAVYNANRHLLPKHEHAVLIQPDAGPSDTIIIAFNPPYDRFNRPVVHRTIEGKETFEQVDPLAAWPGRRLGTKPIFIG
jgi:hypothetical protein